MPERSPSVARPTENHDMNFRTALSLAALALPVAFGCSKANGDTPDAKPAPVVATTPKLAVKAEIYPKLDAICPPDCVFAANTSCISITKLGGFTKRAAQVCGMHFMNPVPMKNTVELIRGQHTTDDTVARGKEFLKQMGKEAVVVNDMPGFVSNRVLMLTVNEAIWLVQDGVASAADVDKMTAVLKRFFA